MKKHYILLSVLGILILTGAGFYPKAHRWARAHVNYKTATEDHPLKCTSCHLHIQRDGLVHNLVNAEYYSPFNLAVSKNGKMLFVVAEEGNALLIVNAETQ
jgi:hypothetical protein